jgi:hypothetical protein
VRVLALFLLASVALPVAVANAHGGNRVVEVVAGPYIISASVSHAGDQIDETIAVIDAASKDVVRNATVTLTLERGDERLGPFLARPLEGSYEAGYPPPAGGGWTVLIEVEGPQGGAAVRHPYRAPDGDGIGGGAGLLLNLGLLVLLAAAVFLVPRLGRTRPPPAAAEGSEDATAPS